MTAVPDIDYRCPSDLTVNETKLRRIAIVGSCLIDGLPHMIEHQWPGGCPVDYHLFNNVGLLPATPAHPIADYDFQIVQIPLRSIMPDNAYFRLRYDDPAAYERLFDESAERLRQFMAAAMRWNADHGMPSFVFNFPTAQQNPMGRLLPRYDLRNPVYFVEQLNRTLDDELRGYSNAYMFDFDSMIDTFGRRNFNDDMVWQLNHGSSFGDYDHRFDDSRLEQVSAPSAYYPQKAMEIMRAAWVELTAMYRTVRRIDEVKMVIFDLDDTLWRGVAAEGGETHVEGWPLGIAEAIGYLKRRGILLTIVSKNDAGRVAALWPKIWKGRLALEDFAIRKINWRPKMENFEEVLAEANLLPRSILYIDDNPVERAAIEAAFPGIRTLGPNPYLWRRILLWAPEMQVAQVTAESARRTEMVQAQVERETQRKRLTPEEFLASLNLSIRLIEISSAAHPQFARSVELINKTNQFNTTGRRWTDEECNAFLRDGGRFFAFEVEDRFTEYGNVGVVIVRRGVIEQFVMSCRVLGLGGIEQAALAEIDRAHRILSAAFVETDANGPCRDLYARCGFERCGDEWMRLHGHALPMPSHIKIGSEEGVL